MGNIYLKDVILMYNVIKKMLLKVINIAVYVAFTYTIIINQLILLFIQFALVYERQCRNVWLR